MTEPSRTRPELPEVTLVAVTSIGIEATVEALLASIRQVRFGRALLLSDRRPAAIDGTTIEWRQIARLRSKADYSRFMLHELAAHIDTSHLLCVQWDGYVLRGDRWDSAFLDYDYIGAVWPHVEESHNVGNGGFSLRSKRLLNATKALPYDGHSPEDLVIAQLHREQLEAADGLRFAPASVAALFSFERCPPSGAEFGFHGAFNLVNLVPRRRAFRILQSLEPQVLNRNEHKELLRWALRRGYLELALLLGRRMVRRRLSTD